MPYLDYDGLTRFKGKLDDTYKQKQTAKVDPVVDGVGTDFISSVTQDTNGAITATKKTVRTLIGATSNVNGSSGLAPAPSAGDTEKYLSGDGTWKNAPVSKPYAFELDMISVETAGAYTRTTTGLPTTSTMKPINVECSNPDIFNDKIRVTVNNGSITISCDSMDVGTSYVTVTVMELGDAESAGTAIRTEEFDILASRINAKMDKASGAAPGKYLQINSSGTPVWGEAASPTAVASATTAWLDANIPTGQTVVVDSSLSISGAAADAKETGLLKSALDTYNDAALYNKIVFLNGKCIDLTAATVDLYTPISNDNYECAVVPCKSGDVFAVNILGGGAYRAWGFLRANRSVISVSDAYASLIDYKLTAPTDSAYLVINNRYTVIGHSKSYKQNTNAPENLFEMTNAESKTIGNLTRIPANSTDENWLMGFSGGAEQKSGYTFDRYAVQAGDIIYIHVNQCDAYVLWRFSSNGSGSSGNLIGELQHESYKGLIEVPEGATYIFISRLTSDTETGVYYPSKQAGIVRGPVFMFVTNDKLNIICGDTAFGFIGKKYMSLASWSTQLNVTTACAIVMTPSGFKTVSYTENAYQVNLKVTDIIVAYVWGGKVFSFGQPVIICNDPPLLAKWYQRENVPVYVNNKKINNYSIALRPSNYAKDYGYFYKFTNAYLTSGERWAYCYGDDLKQDYTGNGIFVQNTANIANKKILCIGDSFTARGWYQHQIKSHEASVQFVGTRQTNYHEYMSEGYSGASANQIFGHYYVDLSDGQTKVSPFWNPSTEKPDFAYYCSQNNISPDYVVIMFGLNETNAINYYNAVQDMVSQIADYNTAHGTNIIAYVVEPMVQANLPADKHSPSNQGYMCGRYWYILEDCVRIPGRTILVDEYDYNSGTVEYGYGLNAHDGLSDAIHPSESVGFKKIGDQIYNWLGVSSND